MGCVGMVNLRGRCKGQYRKVWRVGLKRGHGTECVQMCTDVGCRETRNTRRLTQCVSQRVRMIEEQRVRWNGGVSWFFWLWCWSENLYLYRTSHPFSSTCTMNKALKNARLFVRKDRDAEFYVSMAHKFAKRHQYWYIVASGTQAIETSCLLVAMIQTKYTLVNLTSTTKRSSKASHYLTEVIWTVQSTVPSNQKRSYDGCALPTMYVCSAQKIDPSLQLQTLVHAQSSQTPVRLAAAGIALGLMFQIVAQCRMQIWDFVLTLYEHEGKRTVGIVVVTANPNLTQQLVAQTCSVSAMPYEHGPFPCMTLDT